MSQMARVALSFVAFLAAITLAHGTFNLGWLEPPKRRELVVGHLPVT